MVLPVSRQRLCAQSTEQQAVSLPPRSPVSALIIALMHEFESLEELFYQLKASGKAIRKVAYALVTVYDNARGPKARKA
ncbi:Uncharacterised protein [Pseudomonas putida]|uniref:Uncharacterized protein n=1 Tax=Pseudomonas putida TaxID=303 RepID=A0A379KLT9_PSEPU|nr:Uncharacterised protein [Pseudomonas putida]